MKSGIIFYLCKIIKRAFHTLNKYINELLQIQGPEYGTMEAAWKAVLVESDRRCDLHNRVKEDLTMKVNNQLKLWQRENYHKVSINIFLCFCI